MRTCVGLPVPERPDADRIAECAALAEQLGFHAVSLTDHPAPPEAWLRITHHHTVDPFVGLAIAAASTSTVRLHTNVAVLGYRHPLQLAKSAASLDALSGGRLLLGVGVGYLREEFAALGVEFDQRGTLADSSLATLSAALRGDAIGDAGSVTRPLPRQRPHPPIWIGGNSRAAIRRAARFAQGWAPMPAPPAASEALDTPPLDDPQRLAARVAELHQLAAEHGRDGDAGRLDVIGIPPSLSGFATSRWEVGKAVDEVGDLVNAGVTVLSVHLGDSEPAAWQDDAARFAEGVLTRI